ncbi:MAG: hypothetical protein FJ033_14125 [Chloroflexi bacterium]|nr:hypothetical protein [Chloroflexota bacterium]
MTGLPAELERVVIVALVAALFVAASLGVRTWVRRATDSRLGRVLAHPVRLDDPTLPTIIYFFGQRCGACSAQRAELSLLPGNARANVVAVDAHESADLAGWAGVLTVPSTAVIDPRRRLLAVNHGFVPATTLVSQIRLSA